MPEGLEIGPRGPSVCWSKCARGSRDRAQGSKCVGVQLCQIAQGSKCEGVQVFQVAQGSKCAMGPAVSGV